MAKVEGGQGGAPPVYFVALPGERGSAGAVAGWPAAHGALTLNPALLFHPFAAKACALELPDQRGRGLPGCVGNRTMTRPPTALPSPPPNLADHIARVDDSAYLAPELSSGEEVVYHSPQGGVTQAAVAQVDHSTW